MGYLNITVGYIAGGFGLKGLTFEPPLINQFAYIMGLFVGLFSFAIMGLIIHGAIEKLRDLAKT